MNIVQGPLRSLEIYCSGTHKSSSKLALYTKCLPIMLTLYMELISTMIYFFDILCRSHPLPPSIYDPLFFCWLDNDCDGFVFFSHQILNFEKCCTTT